MKKVNYILLGVLFSMITVFSQSRKVSTLNNGWQFHKGSLDTENKTSFNDVLSSKNTSWQTVNIPHTWNDKDAIDDTPDYYRGVSWYKKNITLYDIQNDKNGNILIYFEGANQVTDLYVNGNWVGQHKGGYTRFHFNITKFVKFGKKNELAVKVDNSHNMSIPTLSGDFTFFGGIYRDIFLVELNNVHFSYNDFSSSGVYITTPEVSKKQAKISINFLLNNSTTKNKKVHLINKILDDRGNVILENIKKVKIKKEANDFSISENILLDFPNLWSPDNPYLYKVVSQIKDAKTGDLLDELVHPLGLRWYKFDPAKGFFLNGKYLKLIGTNRHQDFLNKGNALADEFHVRDVRLLKEMGGNFLRIAHYPQDPTVLELCDRLGILATVEIPIVNRITESDAFSENSLFMAEEMVKQNFNHPSLIIWAYMNEVLLSVPSEIKKDEERYKIYANNVTKLAQKIENRIRNLDTERYTMIPNHGSIKKYKAAGLTAVPMILGWNQYLGWYGGTFAKFDKNLDRLHKTFPNQAQIITEYGADVHHSLHSFDSERFDYSVEYGNRFHEHYLKAIMERPFIVGANIWNLNDFYSERRGFAMPHTNLKGITTLNREKKDTWWLYKTRFSKKPIIKFGQNQWKIRGGIVEAGTNYCTQPVNVYTNGNSVELYHNNKTYYAKVVDNIARFSIPFVNGFNKLTAKSNIDSKFHTDVLEVDFRLAPDKFSEYKEEFYDVNVLLGSKRMYEDRDKGQIWVPEQEYKAGSWGFVGGYPYKTKTRFGNLPSSESEIKNTKDDPIYQTQRININAFKLDVPNGKYVITLHWAELISDREYKKLANNLGGDKISEKVEKRIFNVLINDNYTDKNLNIRAQFGAESAISKKYEIVVSNGKGIGVNFEVVAGEPILNAIQIRKIY